MFSSAPPPPPVFTLPNCTLARHRRETTSMTIHYKHLRINNTHQQHDIAILTRKRVRPWVARRRFSLARPFKYRPAASGHRGRQNNRVSAAAGKRSLYGDGKNGNRPVAVVGRTGDTGERVVRRRLLWAVVVVGGALTTLWKNGTHFK